LIVVIAAGLWLIAVGGLMAARPRYCLELFERMTASLETSNWRLQITEQGLRVAVGLALVVRAPMSKVPLALELAGLALLVSSALVLVAPVRWHAAYGRWWVDRIAPWAVCILSPLPLVAGTALVYAAL
jgi:hypothetical protein